MAVRKATKVPPEQTLGQEGAGHTGSGRTSFPGGREAKA